VKELQTELEQIAADGTEVTPTWVPHFADPTKMIRIWTGDIEIHITADVAYGVMQYWHVTGDDAWMHDHGAEIVLDGASFFASAAQLEQDGKYHYRNVIGPDEYHDRIDDNAFTNVMAKWHLETALEVLAWLRREHPEKHVQLTDALNLTPERLAHWAHVIGAMFIGLVLIFSVPLATEFFQLTDPGEDAASSAGSAQCQAAAGELAADVLDYEWGYEWQVAKDYCPQC
jgi:kojibiose phosphorylase